MFAAIYIPDFFLQAVLRHTPDARTRPVALMDPALPAPVIIQATLAAQTAGVVGGLTASQALARCPGLDIRIRLPDREASATEILLQTAYAFSPHLEDTRPGVCTLALKGLGLEMPGAVPIWAERLQQSLRTLSFEAQIGIGPTPDLALLAAHRVCAKKTGSLSALPTRDVGRFASRPPGSHLERLKPLPARRSEVIETRKRLLPLPGGEGRGEGGLPSPKICLQIRGEVQGLESTPQSPPSVSIIEDAESFVSPLPIASLSPSAHLLEILARWGIRTVGEFLALGRVELAERLGPEALELFLRVSPDNVRPLKRVAPPEQFLEQIEFEHEIETMEPLLFWLRGFIEQLSRRLEAIHLVVAQLQLRLGLSSGDTYERGFKMPSPTGQVEILFRMLQTHLETLRTDSPIVSLQLAATPAKPEAHQFGLFQNTLRNPNQFAETLARLTALVGPENAGTPVLAATHRPDTFAIQPPNFEFVPRGDAPVPPAVSGPQFRRFRPPLPAQFEFRGDQPAHVRSKIFTGPVTGARGPFLASGNWWDDRRWAREEWDVATAGGPLLRLFRSGDDCFVEGVYD